MSFILIVNIGTVIADPAAPPPGYTKEEVCALVNLPTSHTCSNGVGTWDLYATLAYKDYGRLTCLQDSNGDWFMYSLGFMKYCLECFGGPGDCCKMDECKDQCTLLGFTTFPCTPPCTETNEGVEIFDGLDNDCDNIIDEDDSDTPNGLAPLGGSFSDSIYDNLTSYWTMDSDDGSDDEVVIDVFGDNDGGVTNAIQIDSDFELNEQTYEFNGVDNVLNIPDNETFNMGGGDLTISTWVKTSSLEEGHPFNKFEQSGGYYLRIQDSIVVARFKDTLGNDLLVRSSPGIADGVWHNVVIVREGNIGKIYIDALLNSEDSVPTLESLDNDLDVMIGRERGGDFFDGQIDEVAIWGRALTEVEVQNIFNSYFVVPPVCGNGIIEETESCDDGNTDNNDGCSSFCVIESGWSCTTPGSPCCEIEAICSDGNTLSECIDGENARLIGECFLNEDTGCYEYEVEEDWNKDNCDDGELCIVSGTSGQCINIIPDDNGEVEQVAQYCGDYEIDDDCDNDIYDLGEDTVNQLILANITYTPSQILSTEGFCDANVPIKAVNFSHETYAECNLYVSDCGCNWDDSCGFKYTEEIRCEGGVVFQDECEFSTDVNKDTSGFITYTRTPTADSPSTCLSSIKTYKTVETAQLSFFGAIGAVIAVMLIASVYYINSRKPKKK